MSNAALDRLLIQEALAKYVWGYDTSDFALLADAFTENATSGGVVSGTDIKWGPMQGRAEIVSILEGIRKSQSDQRRHNFTSVLFERLTDTTATFRTYLCLTSAENSVPRLVTGGAYSMDAVKQGDVWRISRLDGILDAPF